MRGTGGKTIAGEGSASMPGNLHWANGEGTGKLITRPQRLPCQLSQLNLTLAPPPSEVF